MLASGPVAILRPAPVEVQHPLAARYDALTIGGWSGSFFPSLKGIAQVPQDGQVARAIRRHIHPARH